MPALGSSRSFSSLNSILRKQLPGMLSSPSSSWEPQSSGSNFYDDSRSERSSQSSSLSAISSREDLDQTTKQTLGNTNLLFQLQEGRHSSPSIIESDCENSSIGNRSVSSLSESIITTNEEEEDHYQATFNFPSNLPFGDNHHNQWHLSLSDASTDSEEEGAVFTAIAIKMTPVWRLPAIDVEQEVPVLRPAVQPLISVASSGKSHTWSDPLEDIEEEYEGEREAERKRAGMEGSFDTGISSPYLCDGGTSGLWGNLGTRKNSDTALPLSHSEASIGCLKSPSQVTVSSPAKMSRGNDMEVNFPLKGAWGLKDRQLNLQIDDEDDSVYQPPYTSSANSKFSFSSSRLCRKLNRVFSKDITTRRFRSSKPATYIRDVLSTCNTALFHRKRAPRRTDTGETLSLNLAGNESQLGRRQPDKWNRESDLAYSVSSDQISEVMGQFSDTLASTEITWAGNTEDDGSLKNGAFGSTSGILHVNVASKQQIEDKASPSIYLTLSPSSLTSTSEQFDFDKHPSTTSFFGEDFRFENLAASAYDPANTSSIVVDPRGWRDDTPRIKADTDASWLMPGGSGRTFQQAMLDSQAQRDKQLEYLDTRFSRQGHYLKDVMTEDLRSENGFSSDLLSLGHLIV